MNADANSKRTAAGSTVVTAMFTCPIGDGAALLPRTTAIANAYHALLVENHERLAGWEPWAVEPPTPERTRSSLEAKGRAWLEGKELPLAIAVGAEDRWQLVGSAGLRIDEYLRSAEAGYWIDSSFEGRGLVTRTMSVLLDQAFGALDLARVTINTEVANDRSRSMATRLGFVEEGVRRQAIGFPDGRRDEVSYGLLAEEWLARRRASSVTRHAPGVFPPR
ncbi:MAG: GNAT family N-acetyltransferase [Solirubrobacteraceae bacterium]